MMCLALDHWFLDACGTSADLEDTAANQKRKWPAVPAGQTVLLFVLGSQGGLLKMS